MSTVLAALDATPASEPVLATAVEIGRSLDADVRALHVGPPDEVLAALAGKAGVPLTVVAGTPVSTIIQEGEHQDVALVTLALHGLPHVPEPDGPPGPPGGRHVPGQTALSVATQLSKPVVVVPPTEPVRGVVRRVLFPLDGSRGVSTGVRSMIGACQAADIEVIAVHVFDVTTVPRFSDGLQDVAVWRDEFLAQHCAELNVPLRTAPGPTAPALLRIAAEDDVDVIALGWHQNLTPAHARVVRHVLSAARRPVALVPLPDPTQQSDAER